MKPLRVRITVSRAQITPHVADTLRLRRERSSNLTTDARGVVQLTTRVAAQAVALQTDRSISKASRPTPRMGPQETHPARSTGPLEASGLPPPLASSAQGERKGLRVAEPAATWERNEFRTPPLASSICAGPSRGHAASANSRPRRQPTREGGGSKPSELDWNGVRESRPLRPPALSPPLMSSSRPGRPGLDGRGRRRPRPAQASIRSVGRAGLRKLGRRALRPVRPGRASLADGGKGVGGAGGRKRGGALRGPAGEKGCKEVVRRWRVRSDAKTRGRERISSEKESGEQTGPRLPQRTRPAARTRRRGPDRGRGAAARRSPLKLAADRLLQADGLPRSSTRHGPTPV
jgi:hypothetical protein